MTSLCLEKRRGRWPDAWVKGYRTAGLKPATVRVFTQAWNSPGDGLELFNSESRNGSDQPFRVWVSRVVKDKIDIAFFYNLAGIEDHDLFTHLRDGSKVIRDIEDGCSQF